MADGLRLRSASRLDAIGRALSRIRRALSEVEGTPDINSAPLQHLRHRPVAETHQFARLHRLPDFVGG